MATATPPRFSMLNSCAKRACPYRRGRKAEHTDMPDFDTPSDVLRGKDRTVLRAGAGGYVTAGLLTQPVHETGLCHRRVTGLRPHQIVAKADRRILFVEQYLQASGPEIGLG